MKLSVREAAKRAGVCVSIVYGWCAARLVAHFRLGGKGRRGRIVIEDSDLDAYLASCRVEAKVEPVSHAKRARPAKPLLKHLRLRPT